MTKEVWFYAFRLACAGYPTIASRAALWKNEHITVRQVEVYCALYRLYSWISAVIDNFAFLGFALGRTEINAKLVIDE
ncbi:MAG: hypothetical protein ACYC9J_09115 [Sulfuricaulis sp.]